MFRFIKKSTDISLNINCKIFKVHIIKNQEFKVRKVIIDNDYMTFLYKIKVDKCVGSCNDLENPYFKFCSPDIVKNISIKSFDLISRKIVLRNVSFHKSYKCSCLLDEKVCNNKQKWSKKKCRCECLKIEKCSGNSFFNVVNCSCQMKKAAALIVEKCYVETDDVIKNKTITLIIKVEDCNPFVASSVLFVCISIITTGIMTYFYCKSKNRDVLPY